MSKDNIFLYSRDFFFKRNFPFHIGRYRHLQHDFPPNQYHVRDFYKIVYFFNGEGEYWVEDRHYPIQSGSAILVHPNFQTTYQLHGSFLDICNIVFLPEFIQETLPQLQDDFHFFSIFGKDKPQVSCLYSFPEVQFLEKLICRMEDEYRDRNENYRIELKLLLTDLLIQLCRNAKNKYTKFQTVDVLSYLKRQIEDRCMEPFSLEEISRKLHLSKSRLCQLYRKETGTSIMDALNRQRLYAARRLLENSDLSVAEICYRCGFNDLSCFYRNFKKMFEITPHSFRKNGRG